MGDMGHLAVCLNAAAFAYMVIFERESGMFDPLWTKDGFCVSNSEVPYWNSHDLCLYFDTLGALILGLVYWKLHGMPGMEEPNTAVKVNVFGVFFHGIGHGGLGKAMREGMMFNAEEDVPLTEKLLSQTPSQLATTLGSLVLFWIFLMKAAVPKVSWKMSIPMSIVAAFFGAVVPEYLGFTYTQTVLLFAASLNHVTKSAAEKKDISYGLFPLMVALPLVLIGWVESTNCNKIIDFGGHLLYDAYIPFSVLIYYFVCYHMAQSQEKKSKVA